MNFTANKEKWEKALAVAKSVFWILLTITGVVLIFWIMKWVKETFFTDAEDKKGTLENAQKLSGESVESDINKEVKGGAKLSYPESFYHGMADMLAPKFGVINPAQYVEVYPFITKLKNNLDILALKSAWGVRDTIWGVKSINLDQAFEFGSEYKLKAFWKAYCAAIGANKDLTKVK